MTDKREKIVEILMFNPTSDLREVRIVADKILSLFNEREADWVGTVKIMGHGVYGTTYAKIPPEFEGKPVRISISEVKKEI